MIALASLASLVSLGCLIFVLYHMFQAKGLLHAILGFLCSLYALYWGWTNRGVDKNMPMVMNVWLVAIVLTIVLQGMVTANSF